MYFKGDLVSLLDLLIKCNVFDGVENYGLGKEYIVLELSYVFFLKVMFVK